MKIGILTFQNANNYGALLQAYALQSVLVTKGHQADLINYYCEAIQKGTPLFSVCRMTDIFKIPARLLLLPIRQHIANKFAYFRKKYFSQSPLYHPATIQQAVSQYDLFITGSDQVFNPRITGFDANYFLAFSAGKSKNASYAASFGFGLQDLSDKEKSFIRQNLSHLQHISVREQQGAEIIRSLTGQTAQVHIDPTLLLTKAQWQPLVRLTNRKPYIVLYLMHKDPSLIAFAQQLARAKNCQLLYISATEDIRNRVPVKHITPTPQEWLGLFLNAQYVVTNSFHGLAFSTNFNKPFFVGKLPKTWPANSRLENLLRLTGLQNRVYTNFTDNYDKPINWTAVNETLAQERQKAFAYLKKITR